MNPALIPSLNLKNKVAVVTGGSRGIGRAAVECFAKLGANVVVNYLRDEDAAGTVVKEAVAAGVDALAVQADVSRADEAQRLIDETDRKSTRLNSSHANISYAVFCLKKKKVLSR